MGLTKKRGGNSYNLSSIQPLTSRMTSSALEIISRPTFELYYTITLFFRVVTMRVSFSSIADIVCCSRSSLPCIQKVLVCIQDRWYCSTAHAKTRRHAMRLEMECIIRSSMACAVCLARPIRFKTRFTTHSSSGIAKEKMMRKKRVSISISLLKFTYTRVQKMQLQLHILRTVWLAWLGFDRIW